MKSYKFLRTFFFALLSFALLTPAIGTEAAAIFSGTSLATFFLPMPQNVLGMNNTNNESAYQAYLRGKQQFFDAFLPSFIKDGKPDPMGRCKAYVENLVFSQSEIRLEVNLTAAATFFKFGVTPQDQNTTGVQFPTERRLRPQDTLLATEYKMEIAQTAGNTDANYAGHTYPNTQAFAAADVITLRNIFYENGDLQILCNGTDVMPYRRLKNFLYQPQTQQTAPLGAGSPADQVRGSEDGFITLSPSLFLIGPKGYVPQINLKTNLTGLSANVRAILTFNGLLAQNSTSYS